MDLDHNALTGSSSTASTSESPPSKLFSLRTFIFGRYRVNTVNLVSDNKHVCLVTSHTLSDMMNGARVEFGV